MLDLSRTVRLCVSPDAGDDATPRHNTFAAWPAMRGLGRYYEVTVRCRGEADADTGYFINIKHIDAAVRDYALPLLRAAVAGDGAAAAAPMGALIQELLAAVQPALDGTVTALTLTLTPTLRYTVEAHAMHEVILKQQYEFSAAHRLHVPSLSDADNRATFGKCNNPAGHGHNYRVEVAARCPVDDAGRTVEPAALDAAVDEHVIERLDHKHLNRDVPQFADQNPSVENIVRVVWDMLAGHLPGHATLDAVTVWETGKTACTYRGKAAAAAE